MYKVVWYREEEGVIGSIEMVELFLEKEKALHFAAEIARERVERYITFIMANSKSGSGLYDWQDNAAKATIKQLNLSNYEEAINEFYKFRDCNADAVYVFDVDNDIWILPKNSHKQKG